MRLLEEDCTTLSFLELGHEQRLMSRLLSDMGGRLEKAKDRIGQKRKEVRKMCRESVGKTNRCVGRKN